METPILVVDDNEFVTRMIAQMLREVGFDSVCARDGCEASTRFDAGDFILVITDLTMPVMDGVELIRTILGARPETKVIALSDGDRDSERAVGELGVGAVLRKPFEMARLKKIVLDSLRP